MIGIANTLSGPTAARETPTGSTRPTAQGKKKPRPTTTNGTMQITATRTEIVRTPAAVNLKTWKPASTKSGTTAALAPKTATANSATVERAMVPDGKKPGTTRAARAPTEVNGRIAEASKRKTVRSARGNLQTNRPHKGRKAPPDPPLRTRKKASTRRARTSNAHPRANPITATKEARRTPRDVRTGKMEIAARVTTTKIGTKTTAK